MLASVLGAHIGPPTFLDLSFLFLLTFDTQMAQMLILNFLLAVTVTVCGVHDRLTLMGKLRFQNNGPCLHGAS